MSRSWQGALVSWAAERRGEAARGLPEFSSAGGVPGGWASRGGGQGSVPAGERAGVAHLEQVPVTGLSSAEPRNPELSA